MNPQGTLVVGAACVTTPLIPKPARRRRGPPRPPTSPNRRSPPSEPRREPSAVEGGGGRGGGLVARCSVWLLVCHGYGSRWVRGWRGAGVAFIASARGPPARTRAEAGRAEWCSCACAIGCRSMQQRSTATTTLGLLQ